MRGKTLQTVPFKGISTVLWVHQKLPQSTVSYAFPSNESYESKAGCNRTPATVLWVPLSFDATSDAKRFFWRTMVVVVHGPSLRERPEALNGEQPRSTNVIG